MIMSIALLCLTGCGETSTEVIETPTATETPVATATPVVATCTVYFEGGDGTGDAPDSITLEAGETFTVPENTFSLSGYTFNGFWTGWDYIYPGDTYEMITQDLYFTAQWTKATSYSSSGGGGSSSSSSSSSSTTTTTKTTLSAPTLAVVDGVVSWSSVSNASSYTINIDGTDLATTQTATLYSSFNDNEAHTIKVKANAATGSTAYNDSSYSSSVTVAKDSFVGGVDYILLSGNVTLAENIEISNNLVVSSSSKDLDITFDGYTLTINGDLTIKMPSTSGTLNLGATSDADTSKLVVGGVFIIDATSTHVIQNIAVTAESVELSVASDSYIQNKTLSTTSTSSGITVSEGKFQQNTTINTTDISLKEDSKYELPSASVAESIPTLTVASGADITIEKSSIDVEIVPTEEGMTVDLSNVPDDTQIIISGESSAKIETNSNLTIVNNTDTEITYVNTETKEETSISTDKAVNISSKGITEVASVVVSGITATDKEYDGETSVVLSADEYIYDTEGNEITFTATLADANVGLNKEILFTQTSTNENALVTFSKVYATVTQATPTITAELTATAIIYGDAIGNSVLTGSASVEGAFSWKSSSDIPTVAQSGTAFDAIFTPTNDNYKSIETTAIVTVNKADYDISEISLSDKTVTYDGGEQTIAIIGTLPEGVTVVYTGNGVNAGEYNITASFTGDTANYNTIGDKIATLTIEQASIDISGASWSYTSAYTYDGTTKTVELANVPTGVTVSYEGNTAIEADSYTASATGTATDSTNYKISGAVENLSWIISKATPTYTIPTDITATYGETLEDIALTEGFAFVDDSSTSVGNVGTNNFEATYTPTDTDNYEIVNMSIPITVAKADYSDISYDTIYVTYEAGMKLSDFTLETNYAWSTSTTTITSGTATYAATYNADSANYNDFSLSIQIVATESGSYETIDGITYQANEDGTGYSIVDADNSFSDESKVLTSVNGIPVTSIDMYVFNSTAYYNNSENWEDGALYIGNYLIAVSSSAEGDFAIDANTTLIADVAFYSASNITSITIAEANEYFTTVDGVLYNKELSTLIVVPASMAGTYTMPATVTSIETGAFRSNSLTSIETENTTFIYEKGVLFSDSSKTTIVGMARYGFDDYSYTIPNSVTTIEAYAFSSGYSLRALYIPSTVTYIGEIGIMCNSGSNIYIEGGIKDSWDEWWTRNDGSEIFVVEDITLEAAQTLTTLDSGLVLQQINSTDYIVTLYDTTKSNDKDITIADYKDYNIVAIAGFAFDTTDRYSGENYYTDITSIEFPDSVTTIGTCAFNNSYSLEKVVIGDGVTDISYHAFAGCEKLEYVYIPGSVVNVESEAFEVCNENLVIYVDLASDYVSENWDEDWAASEEDYEYTILYSGDGDFYTITYEGIKDSDLSNNPTIVTDLETFFLENATTTATDDRYFLGWTLGQYSDNGEYQDTAYAVVWGSDELVEECISSSNELVFYANWSTTDPLANSDYTMAINITDGYNAGTFAIYTSIDDEENGFYLLKVEDGDKSSGYLRAYAALEEGYVLGEAYFYDAEFEDDNEFYADIKADLAIDSMTNSYGGEYYGFTATVIPVSEATVSVIDHVIVSYEYYNSNLEYVAAEYTYDSDDATSMLSELESIDFNRNDIIGFTAYDASNNEIDCVKITAYSSGTRDDVTYEFTTAIGDGGYSMNNFDYYPNEGSSVYFEIEGLEGYSTISSTMKSITISNMVKDEWVEADNGIYYRIITRDGKSTAIIGDYYGDATSLTIPSTVTDSNGDEYSVTQIESYVFRYASFEEIILPETITYIGFCSFYGCENLESVVIPESVTYIGEEAFRGCKNLEAIYIPNSVNYIGTFVFRYCNEELVIYVEYSEAEVAELIANGSWNENWANISQGGSYTIEYDQTGIPTTPVA